MKKKYIFLIISLTLILVVGLYFVEMNLREWRSDYRRSHYYYEVEIKGLSGRGATGTTEILVPIPATNDGEFVITPSQKEPSILKNLLQNIFFTLRKVAEEALILKTPQRLLITTLLTEIGQLLLQKLKKGTC